MYYVGEINELEAPFMFLFSVSRLNGCAVIALGK